MFGEGLNPSRHGYSMLVSARASWYPRNVPGWTTSLVSTSTFFTLQRSSDEPEFRARLMHTARILAAVAQPGAERFIALEDDGQVTTLVTEFAGGRSLVSDAPHRVRDLAAVGAAIVRTLDGLHETGVTHGPVSRSQIRFGSGLEPVLCGFESGEIHPADDRRSWRADRAADVQSIGVLLAEVLDDASHRAGDLLDRIDRRRLTRLAHKIAAGDLDEATSTLARLERISPGG